MCYNIGVVIKKSNVSYNLQPGMPLEKIIDYSHPDKKSAKHCLDCKGKIITNNLNPFWITDSYCISKLDLNSLFTLLLGLDICILYRFNLNKNGGCDE